MRCVLGMHVFVVKLEANYFTSKNYIKPYRYVCTFLLLSTFEQVLVLALGTKGKLFVLNSTYDTIILGTTIIQL